MFRVGQKVVCIRTWDRSGKGYGDEVGPLCGQLYTIREIGPGLNQSYPDEIQVRLMEVVNSVRIYTTVNGCRVVHEPAFGASRFRPVVERKTDISIFTEMLTPKTRRVQERA